MRHGKSETKGNYAEVYREMLIEICAHYHCLPDPRTLRAREIRFFFEGMRKHLELVTRPRPASK